MKNKKEEVVNNEENVKIRYSYFTDEQYVRFINDLWTSSIHISAYLQKNDIIKVEIFWKLFTCTRAIKQHHQIYLNKRTEILSNYGTLDEASSNWNIDSEKQTDAIEDINRLNDIVIKLDILKLNAGDMIENDIFSPDFGGFQNMTLQTMNRLEDWVDWKSIDTWITKNKKKEE